MKALTSQCLEAAGIKRVVWIDDFFAPRTRNELAAAIHEYVLKLKDADKEKVGIVPFDSVFLGGQRAAVTDAVDELLEGMPDEAVREAAAALEGITGIPLPEVKPQADDLSAAEFDALKQAFGEGLQTFSLGAWTSEGALRFASAGEDTLFLIDKEYKREDAGMDGTLILKNLVNGGGRGFCVMLTHMWAEAEQEDRRVEIAKQYKLPPHQFSVLSKRQNPGLPIDPRFARAIRTVMTHRFNGVIAYTISQTIQASAAATADALTAQSVSELEQVLFENADEEGVFEYDAVLRLFEIQQRHALNEALANEGIQSQLKASRKFRQQTAQLKIEMIKGDMSYFRDSRSREVFFDGTGLNKLHSPLICGDVFETDQGERYVLLAQPCDLMVREKGDRRAEIGLLALVGEPKKPDPKKPEKPRPVPDYRYYDLRDLFGRGEKFFVDFQNLIVVNLSVLDFAVFNADGAVQIRRDHPEPTIVLLKGWSRLFKATKCRVFPKDKPALNPSIGMGKKASKLAGSISGDLLRYPLRRIGRLQSATSTAILAAWATFQTRAAFDHDFAKEEEIETSATSPQADIDPSLTESSAAANMNVEPAAAAKPGPAVADQAESAKETTVEPTATAKTDPTDGNASPQADSGANASPPSGG